MAGRAVFSPNERWQVRLSPMITAKAHESQIVADVDYKGDDFTLSGKMGNAGIFGLGYHQSVNANWSLGAEILHCASQAMTVNSFAVRHTTDETITTAQYHPRDSAVALSHFLRFSDTVTLASELFVAGPKRQSIWTAGMQRTFRNGNCRFKTMFDSSWVNSTVIEEATMFGPILTVSSVLDHKKKSYKFGIGLTISMQAQ
jgi:mitochondrial import receptor subunit TOM40